MVLASGCYLANGTAVGDEGGACKDASFAAGAQDAGRKDCGMLSQHSADPDQTCMALASAACVSRGVLNRLISVLPPDTITNLQLVSRFLVASDEDDSRGILAPRGGAIASNCLRWLVHALSCALAASGGPAGSDSSVIDEVEREVRRAANAIAR